VRATEQLDYRAPDTFVPPTGVPMRLTVDALLLDSPDPDDYGDQE
jgi:hypothetical protein